MAECIECSATVERPIAYKLHLMGRHRMDIHEAQEWTLVAFKRRLSTPVSDTQEDRAKAEYLDETAAELREVPAALKALEETAVEETRS